MGRARTNADETLSREWYCEDCGDATFGVNPPNECDVCGSSKFENGLDIVGEDRPLPVRTRAATLTA